MGIFSLDKSKVFKMDLGEAWVLSGVSDTRSAYTIQSATHDTALEDGAVTPNFSHGKNAANTGTLFEHPDAVVDADGANVYAYLHLEVRTATAHNFRLNDTISVEGVADLGNFPEAGEGCTTSASEDLRGSDGNGLNRKYVVVGSTGERHLILRQNDGGLTVGSYDTSTVSIFQTGDVGCFRSTSLSRYNFQNNMTFTLVPFQVTLGGKFASNYLTNKPHKTEHTFRSDMQLFELLAGFGNHNAFLADVNGRRESNPYWGSNGPNPAGQTTFLSSQRTYRKYYASRVPIPDGENAYFTGEIDRFHVLNSDLGYRADVSTYPPNGIHFSKFNLHPVYNPEHTDTFNFNARPSGATTRTNEVAPLGNQTDGAVVEFSTMPHMRMNQISGFTAAGAAALHANYPAGFPEHTVAIDGKVFSHVIPPASSIGGNYVVICQTSETGDILSSAYQSFNTSAFTTSSNITRLGVLGDANQAYRDPYSFRKLPPLDDDKWVRLAFPIQKDPGTYGIGIYPSYFFTGNGVKNYGNVSRTSFPWPTDINPASNIRVRQSQDERFHQRARPNFCLTDDFIGVTDLIYSAWYRRGLSGQTLVWGQQLEIADTTQGFGTLGTLMPVQNTANDINIYGEPLQRPTNEHNDIYARIISGYNGSFNSGQNLSGIVLPPYDPIENSDRFVQELPYSDGSFNNQITSQQTKFYTKEGTLLDYSKKSKSNYCVVENGFTYQRTGLFGTLNIGGFCAHQIKADYQGISGVFGFENSIYNKYDIDIHGGLQYYFDFERYLKPLNSFQMAGNNLRYDSIPSWYDIAMQTMLSFRIYDAPNVTPDFKCQVTGTFPRLHNRTELFNAGGPELAFTAPSAGLVNQKSLDNIVYNGYAQTIRYYKNNSVGTDVLLADPKGWQDNVPWASVHNRMFVFKCYGGKVDLGETLPSCPHDLEVLHVHFTKFKNVIEGWEANRLFDLNMQECPLTKTAKKRIIQAMYFARTSEGLTEAYNIGVNYNPQTYDRPHHLQYVQGEFTYESTSAWGGATNTAYTMEWDRTDITPIQPRKFGYYSERAKWMNKWGANYQHADDDIFGISDQIPHGGIPVNKKILLQAGTNTDNETLTSTDLNSTNISGTRTLQQQIDALVSAGFTVQI